jgi:hypothetical protein
MGTVRYVIHRARMQSHNSADIAAKAAVLVGAPDHEIVAMEARLRDAQLRADVGVLDELLDDDLLFAGPGGDLATKAQDLETHRSGVVHFQT